MRWMVRITRWACLCHGDPSVTQRQTAERPELARKQRYLAAQSFAESILHLGTWYTANYVFFFIMRFHVQYPA